MNIYTSFIISINVFFYLLKILINFLNIKKTSNNIPEEFKNYYNYEKYSKSQQYLKETTKFSMITSTIILLVKILFITQGMFNYINNIVISFNISPIFTGLTFVLIFFFIFEILGIPFSIYSIFKIEEKFGFNKMGKKTFFLDLIKSWIVNIIIISIILPVILFIFINSSMYSAWLYVFVSVIIFEIFIIFISPTVIMPIFNKYTPIEDCNLKNEIEIYMKKENFKMSGLFKIDASKRSTKSNAFFTGLGKFRRIVLYDTIIKNHNIHEILSILAHEMGHYKLKHIKKQMIISFIITGTIIFFISLFVNKNLFYYAFLVNGKHIYIGIVLFIMYIYIPFYTISSIILNYYSRKCEHEADIYSIKTYNHKDDMINALKKLSVDNLSNLYPHKLKVFFDYSHPPILNRIKKIKYIK
ncbi:MAG: M48 family metallopeptidase [Endomicrobium sp.]|jgi:STE24 endopeptidase|nr:M48 family metallopeptidase [Endomicrobium sp.]